jgi:hypothetical protein
MVSAAAVAAAKPREKQGASRERVYMLLNECGGE